MKAVKFKTVDEYLSALPTDKKVVLEQLRKIIKETAPHAEEMISYNMPGYKWNGMLVYYAACKDHTGFYTGSYITRNFKEKLKGYKTTKGGIQLPLDKPLPVGLIKKILKYRMKDNLKKIKAKQIRK